VIRCCLIKVHGPISLPNNKKKTMSKNKMMGLSLELEKLPINALIKYSIRKLFKVKKKKKTRLEIIIKKVTTRTDIVIHVVIYETIGFIDESR
jgi:hypothetical protein